MIERDRSPIDQKWIHHYCDEFIKVSDSLPGQMHEQIRDALSRRVECVLDLLDSWQQRNIPIDQRERR